MSVVHKSEDGKVVLLVRDDSPNYHLVVTEPGSIELSSCASVHVSACQL